MSRARASYIPRDRKGQARELPSLVRIELRFEPTAPGIVCALRRKNDEKAERVIIFAGQEGGREGEEVVSVD